MMLGRLLRVQAARLCMGSRSDTTTRIVLVRHGHVDGIAPERFRGRRDVDLSALGLEQARATAQRIARGWSPSGIYTSPLRRCVQTAEAIATACATSLTTLADLNDVDYGEWEWCSHEHVGATWPDLYRCWLTAPQRVRFPNGESLTELAARMSNVLQLILDSHQGHTVVVVSHSANNRVLLLQALGQTLSAFWRLGQDPCGVNEIELAGSRRVTVARMNETCHLDALSPDEPVRPLAQSPEH